LEKVAAEALDATTSQGHGDECEKGKFYCFELPGKVKERGRLDEFSFVCSLSLHSLLKKVVSETELDCFS
jgi:hypothetical protein